MTNIAAAVNRGTSAFADDGIPVFFLFTDKKRSNSEATLDANHLTGSYFNFIVKQFYL